MLSDKKLLAILGRSSLEALDSGEVSSDELFIAWLEGVIIEAYGVGRRAEPDAPEVTALCSCDQPSHSEGN